MHQTLNSRIVRLCQAPQPVVVCVQCPTEDDGPLPRYVALTCWPWTVSYTIAQVQTLRTSMHFLMRALILLPHKNGGALLAHLFRYNTCDFASGLNDAPQTTSSISLHVSRDNTRLGRASSKPARNADACGANSDARNLAKRARYSPKFSLVTGRLRPGRQCPEHLSTMQQGAQGEVGGGRGSQTCSESRRYSLIVIRLETLHFLKVSRDSD